MKKLHNEQGYTLLITLGVLILITLFLTSFQVIAINNAKQIQSSDETYEVTSIAEMGVEYYAGGATYIIEQYMDKGSEKGKLTAEVVKDINIYIKGQKNNTVDQSIIDNHKKILSESIIKDINDFFKTTPNDVLYNLVNIQEVDEKYALQPEFQKWLFTVEGKIPNSSKTQKIAAEFSLENFEIITPTLVENEEEQSITIPEQKFATENRTNLSVGSFSGNDFHVEYFNPTNAEISALGNVNISGMNNMNGLEIVANGNVKINYATDFNNLNLSATTVEFNNLNKIFKSTINVFGDAKIEILNNFFNSNVFINGGLVVNSKIEMNNNHEDNKGSSVIVMGDAKIENLLLSYFSKSKIYIGRNLTVNEKLEINKEHGSVIVNGDASITTLSNFSPSNVYIHGGLTVKDLKNSQGSINVNGTLKVSSANTEITGGTVIVDKIQFTFSPIHKESIKVKATGNTSGKLCIKDIDNIGILKGQAVKATGQGEIIFLDKNLDINAPLENIDANNYEDIEPSDLTGGNDGGHNYVAGLNKFNEACGITTVPSQTYQYRIQEQPIDGLNNVKYID